MATAANRKAASLRRGTLSAALGADPAEHISVNAGMIQELAGMIEDARDAAILARRIAEDQDDAGKPLDVVERLIAGENAVRVHRQWRRMTQARLAAAARLSQAHIADIENGKRTGSLAALRAIAAALRVGLDDIVGG